MKTNTLERIIIAVFFVVAVFFFSKKVYAADPAAIVSYAQKIGMKGTVFVPNSCQML